jgi:type I restriction enzyme S subunit
MSGLAAGNGAPGVGQSTAEWPVVKSGTLFSVVTSGSRGWAKYYCGEGPAFIRMGNLDHDTISLDLSDIQRVKPPAGAEGTRTRVRPSDILVSVTADVGMVGLVPDGMEEAYINQHVALARPVESVYPRYLAWVLASPIGQRQFRDLQRGATKVGLGLEDIREVRVPLPPLDVQHRIVDGIELQLARLDAGIEGLRRTQANLKRYRAAVLKAACEGRLVPTEAGLARQAGRPGDFESGEALLARILEERQRSWKGKGKYKEPVGPDTTGLPELPEGWAWGTLDALAELVGGITKDQQRKLSTPARSVPYLRVANVQRGYLDLAEMKEIVATEAEIEELALRPGDVLFNEGGDRDKLGRGWIWSGELPACIHQNHVFRARLYGAGMSPRLVSWYANTYGQKFFFDEGKHTTNLASISMSKLRRLTVPIPPPAEQVRIVAEVERRLSVIDELISVLHGNLQRVERLRQSVLQRAFSGGK